MGDEEGVSRADPRVEYIAARVQATFPKMVVSTCEQGRTSPGRGLMVYSLQQGGHTSKAS